MLYTNPKVTKNYSNGKNSYKQLSSALRAYFSTTNKDDEFDCQCWLDAATVVYYGMAKKKMKEQLLQAFPILEAV